MMLSGDFSHKILSKTIFFVNNVPLSRLFETPLASKFHAFLD